MPGRHLRIDPVGRAAQCQFTQGYWQNRAQNANDLSTEVWMAIRDQPFYLSGLSYRQVLQVAPKGNAYWILAHQLVAAQSNYALGAESVDIVSAALARADQLMAQYTPDQIAAMLQEGFATAQQDMQARALVEARVDADRMLVAIRSALAADADLLTPEERATIDGLVTALQTAIGSEDAAVVEAATDALAKGTEAFAAQRMNRGIQQALAGKKLEEV